MNGLNLFKTSRFSRRHLYCLLAAALVGLGFIGIGAAQDDQPVEIELVAELRVPVAGAGGHTSYQFVPASIIEQGQEIYYTVRIHNPGAEAVPEVVVVQALPTNTHYVAGSATGAGADIQFSVDGGKTFAVPAQLKEPSNAGSGSERVAAADQYTHIRWQLQHPLAPKATVLARFRAIFE